MEITKREILASVTIIAVMMILGIVIAGRIDAYQVQKNSEYYAALQITDMEQFQYGMDTSVGNAFVYGTLEAAEPVTYPGDWRRISVCRKSRRTLYHAYKDCNNYG